jgi:hypothetical protein
MRNAFDGLPDLISPGAIGQQVQDAFKQGRIDGAVRAFAKNPNDPGPVGALMALDPATAIRLRGYQHDEEKTAREGQFRSALSDYMQAQHPSTDALANAGAVARHMPTAIMPGVSGGPVPNVGAAGVLSGGPGQETAQPQAPDLSMLGPPQSAADHAFLEMLRADPEQAMKIDSQMRDNFAKRLKAEHEAFGYGIARLGGVSDPETYQARRAEIVQHFAPLGIDIGAALPEQFPGEKGLRDIRLQGLDLKDQIAAIIGQDKADAYVGNIEADNARADRNTESLIDDRSARFGETRRYHDVQSGNARRAQDLGSADRHRGQDIASGDRRRGQDLRPPSAGRRPQAMPTATGPNGQKVQWNGKAWVPLG